MIYYYLKPYSEPENHVLHVFGCTPAFSEMEQVFFTMALLAEESPVFREALDNMTLQYE